MEPNPFMADFCNRNGLDVRNEMVEETTITDGTFDAITIFEVIEHVKHPMPIMRKLFALLRLGGVLFVYTPNFDCAERLLLGEKSHFIWGSNHQQYFTVDTLRDVLQRTGFVMEHWETQGLDRRGRP